MANAGVLLFTQEEYEVFMSCQPAIAYDPAHYDFEGREVIVNEFEIEKKLDYGRYLVQKKWG